MSSSTYSSPQFEHTAAGTDLITTVVSPRSSVTVVTLGIMSPDLQIVHLTSASAESRSGLSGGRSTPFGDGQAHAYSGVREHVDQGVDGELVDLVSDQRADAGLGNTQARSFGSSKRDAARAWGLARRAKSRGA